MILTKKTTYGLNLLTLKKITSSKGNSRKLTVFKNKLPLQCKYKWLQYSKKWKAGRGNTGQKVLRTRGTRGVKYRLQNINYSFRYRHIFFIASFIFNNQLHKLISVIFLSSGAISQLITTSQHKLFTLNQFNSPLLRNEYFITNLNLPALLLSVSLVMNLPKNKPISLLELVPYRKIQYIRSAGTLGIMLKMDLRVHTALIKLPSGVKKVFSTYSLGSIGSVALTTNRIYKNNIAGLRKNKGFKPVVRGVAMNPVDHPHGGRAKAIKYQRTPWGKTTKYK